MASGDREAEALVTEASGSHVAGDGRADRRRRQSPSALGLEGIVAKRLEAPYRPGERVRLWVALGYLSPNNYERRMNAAA
jgi:ATP-dependent DNA ligase